MRYIIHDTTNGGTDNGISRSAISNFTEQVAEELGLDYQDYNLYDIVLYGVVQSHKNYKFVEEKYGTYLQDIA